MRDLWIMLSFIMLLPQCFMQPVVAMLVWTWFAIMNPHRETFSFAYSFPFNSIIAAVFFVAWLMSNERRLPPLTPFAVCFALYLLWIPVTLSTALAPNDAWQYFTEIPLKVFIFAWFLLVLFHTKHRLNALIYLYCASLGYYIVTVAANVIIKRGANFSAANFGPSGTMIGDNNILALAMVTTLPLLHYLWRHDDWGLWMRRLLKIIFVLGVIAVVGSYSRGGFLSLLVAAAFYWQKSRNKVKTLVAVAVCGGVVLTMMPAEWYQRVDIKESSKNDESVQGRFLVWGAAWQMAVQHPLTGAGFKATENANVMQQFVPPKKLGDPQFILAAHSIYFQTLSNHGFVGFGLFLSMFAALWRMLYTVRRSAKNNLEWLWAYDLAGALQASLAAFMVGGAFLSVAYYDGWYILAALIAGLYTVSTPLHKKIMAPRAR